MVTFQQRWGEALTALKAKAGELGVAEGSIRAGDPSASVIDAAPPCVNVYLVPGDPSPGEGYGAAYTATCVVVCQTSPQVNDGMAATVKAEAMGRKVFDTLARLWEGVARPALPPVAFLGGDADRTIVDVQFVVTYVPS